MVLYLPAEFGARRSLAEEIANKQSHRQHYSNYSKMTSDISEKFDSITETETPFMGPLYVGFSMTRLLCIHSVGCKPLIS